MFNFFHVISSLRQIFRTFARLTFQSSVFLLVMVYYIIGGLCCRCWSWHWWPGFFWDLLNSQLHFPSFWYVNAFPLHLFTIFFQLCTTQVLFSTEYFVQSRRQYIEHPSENCSAVELLLISHHSLMHISRNQGSQPAVCIPLPPGIPTPWHSWASSV